MYMAHNAQVSPSDPCRLTWPIAPRRKDRDVGDGEVRQCNGAFVVKHGPGRKPQFNLI